jgi:hypothetical protein
MKLLACFRVIIKHGTKDSISPIEAGGEIGETSSSENFSDLLL